MNRILLMQNPSSIMPNQEEDIQHVESECRHREEVHGGDAFAMIPQKGEPALPGFVGSRSRRIQRETLRSETSNPSMTSSPWMHGARQVGFSAVSELLLFQPRCGKSRDHCWDPHLRVPKVSCGQIRHKRLGL